jgi:long-chain acyl-CoA synthetase
VLTLPDMLRSTAQCHGKRIAIRDGDASCDWQTYLARIQRTAGMLQGLGLKRGERFAILGRNSVLQAQLIYGGYWSGIVPVPINFRLSQAEIVQLLEDCGCRRLMIDNAFAHWLDEPAFAEWRAGAVLIPVDGGHPSLPAIDELIARAEPVPAQEVHEDDDALQLYTGGTTALGKGVRLSHRNILSNALQLARVMSVREDDVYLHVAPMFHSGDLKATVVTMFGGSHVYLKEFTPAGVMQAVERERITILSIVPAMITRVLQEGALDRYDLSSLRLISYGTSPMGERTLRAALAAFGGVGFHQCYGLTENSPFIAILDEASHLRALKDKPELLRAAGRLLPGVQLRLLDDHGAEVPPGGVGEIVVRGPQLARGYLNRPRENAEAFRNGWFHTGDIGCLDDEGYLYVLDRKKDMVKTGGENVYPREVESVLQLHEDIADVAVVGVPDERFGEALLAAVVLRPGRAEPSPEALIAFCRNRLGGYKIPRQYMFVQQLPRTAVGKVRKPDVVAAYLQSRTVVEGQS